MRIAHIIENIKPNKNNLSILNIEHIMSPPLFIRAITLNCYSYFSDFIDIPTHIVKKRWQFITMLNQSLHSCIHDCCFPLWTAHRKVGYILNKTWRKHFMIKRRLSPFRSLQNTSIKNFSFVLKYTYMADMAAYTFACTSCTVQIICTLA